MMNEKRDQTKDIHSLYKECDSEIVHSLPRNPGKFPLFFFRERVSHRNAIHRHWTSQFLSVQTNSKQCFKRNEKQDAQCAQYRVEKTSLSRITQLCLDWELRSKSLLTPVVWWSQQKLFSNRQNKTSKTWQLHILLVYAKESWNVSVKDP